MSNMQGFGSQMNFTQDPYSMGGDAFGGPFGGGGMFGEDPSPFGGGAPFGGDQWGGREEEFSGMGEPYSDLTGGPDPQTTRSQNDEVDGADDGGDDEDDHGENHYEDETDYGEGEDGEVRLENEDDDDEIDQKDLDPSSFPYSTPMNEPGDEQIMQDAKILRERDGIAKTMAEAGFDNHEIQTGDGEEFNGPVASETVQAETGSNVVQEEVRPKKKLKEKFMRDREQLERLMNAQGDSIYRRADEPPPGRKPPADDLPGHQNPGEYPPSRHPREARIMSGQEIKQQMAMQKLARAALKAMGKRGGAKKGGKVVKNAKTLCAGLQQRGYKISTDGTDVHLVLVDLRNIKLSGSKAEFILEEISVACNKNTVPGDKSAMNPSGIRLGTPALTTRGLKEPEIEKVVDFIDRALKLALEAQNLSGPKLVDYKKVVLEDNSIAPKVKSLRREVAEFAGQFPVPSFHEL